MKKYLNYPFFACCIVFVLTVTRYYTHWQWIPFCDYSAFGCFVTVLIGFYGKDYFEAKRLVRVLFDNPELDIRSIFLYLERVDKSLFLWCVDYYNHHFFGGQNNQLLLYKTNLSFSLKYGLIDQKTYDDLLNVVDSLSQTKLVERNLEYFRDIIEEAKTKYGYHI